MYMGGLLGCPVQSQELDSMIFLGPSQPRIYYDFMNIPGILLVAVLQMIL